jgi:malate dehydrogenase
LLSAGRCCAAGVEKVYGLGELNDYEQEGLKAMMPELIASIEKGMKFVKEN